MKLAFIAFCAAFVTWQCSAGKFSTLLQWEMFKLKHNKKYGASENEERYQIFQENAKKISQHNELYKDGLITYKLGINQFSDMTHEEFLNFLTKSEVSSKYKPKSVLKVFDIQDDIPDAIDWRNRSIVTQVKDQGECGSCWSFSAVGALEGQQALATGNLIEFSQQQLIDCASDKYETYGCSGGWPDEAFYYTRDHGLTTEDDYPYAGKQQNCSYTSKERSLNITHIARLSKGDEEQLKIATATIGPIAIMIDSSNWEFYEEGIYYEELCRADWPNHAVLVVGYGSEDDNDFWLIKNSWGSDWGLDGYMKLARNRLNQCGVASKATFPVIA